ncbi:uncharacterized protein B0P05DRAFT_529604 [Gilbertella persicaria]|uniref:uncharacterized protein n=1 Tax=Gilbertella persicaria TaxID=101096 RepID=UPI002220551A|nr:uncharacterized protein B0P05DRAFT_529604 [Gilbertella persicaria]KAI8090163.1 hypothetical protein B0P05DRAFT_529604 [Gilbertella persicaria]
MSVGVAPNSIQERALSSEYLQPTEYMRPNQPLLRRAVLQQQQYGPHRRHSIANMDLDTNHHRRYEFSSSVLPLPPPPPPVLSTGHYSAPSSPPTVQNRLAKPYQRPPYTKKSAIYQEEEHLLRNMRRHSSAYQQDKDIAEKRRLSLYSVMPSGKSDEDIEEDEDDEYHKKKTEETEGFYSRSPELRISHKLAERKRRKEMKELFDELKNVLPVDKSIKTSKWEILTKAVEYISVLRNRDYNMEQELMALKQELESVKNS